MPGVPPSTAARPAAAIEQAEPTSPWQPTSAPEIDAFALNSTPIARRGQQELDDAVVVGPGTKRV